MLPESFLIFLSTVDGCFTVPAYQRFEDGDDGLGTVRRQTDGDGRNSGSRCRGSTRAQRLPPFLQPRPLGGR
jgi:hypothetical protein